MLSLLLAAALTEAPPKAVAIPVQQARATVTIVRVSPVRFGFEPGEFGRLRATKVRERDGTLRPASLVEFY